MKFTDLIQVLLNNGINFDLSVKRTTGILTLFTENNKHTDLGYAFESGSFYDFGALESFDDEDSFLESFNNFIG